MEISFNKQMEMIKYLQGLKSLPEASIVCCGVCGGTGLDNADIGGFCNACDGYGKMDWITYSRSGKKWLAFINLTSSTT